jgi:hypothetical protein
MKKEDLLKAVGGADDRFIAEAAPQYIACDSQLVARHIRP